MWGEDIHTVPIDRGSEWCAVCDRFHGERIYFQQRSLLSHDICTRSNYGHRLENLSDTGLHESVHWSDRCHYDRI